MLCLSYIYHYDNYVYKGYGRFEMGIILAFGKTDRILYFLILSKMGTYFELKIWAMTLFDRINRIHTIHIAAFMKSQGQRPLMSSWLLPPWIKPKLASPPIGPDHVFSDPVIDDLDLNYLP